MVGSPLAKGQMRRVKLRPGVRHDVDPEGLLFQVDPGRATGFFFPSQPEVSLYGVT